MNEMRIKDHPILTFRKGRRVKFSLDGRELEGHAGEPIAAALHASGVKILRRSLRYGRPRGFFCAVGKCASCLMKVDGVPNTRVCVTRLDEGMKVETQEGKGDPREKV
jgi:predicted molibdopterin-dependent oxidoreductase YjgC